MDLDERSIGLVDLAFFGHGFAHHPSRGHWAVVFEKRGRGCCEIDLKTRERGPAFGAAQSSIRAKTKRRSSSRHAPAPIARAAALPAASPAAQAWWTLSCTKRACRPTG